MHPKYFYILLLALLATTAASAQPVQTRPVHLETTFTTTPAIHPASIRIDINMPDSTTLGYAITAQLDSVKTLVPDTSISTWLKQYVNTRYNFTPSGPQLVWSITALRLQQSLVDNRNFVQIKAAVYHHTENEEVLIKKIDTVLSGNGNITGMITAALTLMEPASLNAVSTPAVAARSLRMKSNATTAQQDGVYLTYEEFKNNTPSYPDILIDYDTKDSSRCKIYRLMPDSILSEIKSLWGICAQHEVYYFADQLLIPVEVSNNTILLSSYIAPAQRSNQASLWRNMLEMYRTETRNAGLVYTRRIRCNKTQAIATSIDNETGLPGI